VKIASALPTAVLHATTRPLDRLPSQSELLAYADPQNPLVWMRGDRGAVGVGDDRGQLPGRRTRLQRNENRPEPPSLPQRR